MSSVLRQTEVVKDFAGIFDLDGAALPPSRLCRHSEGDEAILAEGQPIVWMTDDIQEEAAVPSRIPEIAIGWAANRQPAKDERTSGERHLLAEFVSLLADHRDRSSFRAVAGASL